MPYKVSGTVDSRILTYKNPFPFRDTLPRYCPQSTTGIYNIIYTILPEETLSNYCSLNISQNVDIYNVVPPSFFANPSITALWLDANDSSTLTLVSGGVSQWNDKSGNNRHATQSTAGLRPTTATILQKTVISLTQDQLDFPAVSFTGSNYHWFTVASMFSSTNGSGRLVSMRGVGQTNDFNNLSSWVAIARNSTNNSIFSQYNSASLTAYAIELGKKYIMQSSLLSTEVQFFVDGILRASNTATPNLNVNQIRIGQSLNGSFDENWDGILHEIVLVTGTLTQANKELIEGYLAWKWNLVANLPSNHPYKLDYPGKTLIATVPVSIYDFDQVP